jgi:hypothetical protein
VAEIRIDGPQLAGASDRVRSGLVVEMDGRRSWRQKKTPAVKARAPPQFKFLIAFGLAATEYGIYLISGFNPGVANPSRGQPGYFDGGAVRGE